MLQKIVSGGQTDTERAALDAAIALNLQWACGPLNARQTVKRFSPSGNENYILCSLSRESILKSNVKESDGTLILSFGPPPALLEDIRKIAMKQTRPWLVVDIEKIPAYLIPSEINTWISKHTIQTLNIAGPDDAQSPGIYGKVKQIIEGLTLLNRIKSKMVGLSLGDNWSYTPDLHIPQTIDDIVSHVIDALSPRDRVQIAYMDQEELPFLDSTLGIYLRKKLEIWVLSRERDFDFIPRGDDTMINVSDMVIEEVWKKLKESHRVRRVK